jgi:branched-chain amino acid transport system substrate-binding protein
MFKFRALSLAAAVACAVASLPAAAQQGTVKIGLITDMTGLYADLDGPAGVEAIRTAARSTARRSRCCPPII